MNKNTFYKRAVDYDLLIKLGTDKSWVKNSFILRKNYKKTSLLRNALHNKTIQNLDKIYDSIQDTIIEQTIIKKTNNYGLHNKDKIENEKLNYDSDDSSDEDYKLCFIDTYYSETSQEL